MDLDVVLSFVQAWTLLLASFFLALLYSIIKGRQNLINLMMGFYFGLFLYKLFPFTNTLIENAGSEKGEAYLSIGVFLALSLLSTIFFTRLMPREFLEGKFESMGKKILLSLAAMILLMTLMIHFLPVGQVFDTGTPLPESLQTEKLAFLWLMIPLVVMFLI